jgi:ParB family transcriptional regulator, chromosome partitioning protein
MPLRNKMLERRPVQGSSAGDDGGRDPLFGTSKDFPRIVELDLDQIDDNPDQPRRHFDEDEIMGLAATIEKNGLIQPILVQKKDDGRYIRVAGERRYRAHRHLGRETIFAIITNGDPAEISLLENLQRVDLDALETANAFARLMNRHGYTQRTLSELYGKTESEVSRTLALLRLPELVQREYQETYRHIPKSLLMELAEIGDEPTQLQLWEHAKAGASVKKMRALKTEVRKPRSAAQPIKKLVAATDRLIKQFDDIAIHESPLDNKQRNTFAKLRDKINGILDR